MNTVALRSKFTNLSVLALAGLLVSLVMSLFTVAPAGAAYYTGSAGPIGSVSLNGPMLVGSDYRINGMYGSSVWLKAWEVGSFVVQRSTYTSATQRVNGVSTIQRWDGRWVNIQTRSWAGNVSGNGTLTFPGWTWAPDSQPQTRSGYRVVYEIAWRVASTNQLLSYTTILPSTLSDSRCRMLQLGCSAFTDGINF